MPLHKIQDSAPIGDADSLKAVLSREEGLIAIQGVIQAVTTPSVKPTLAAIESALDSLINDPA